MAGYKQISKLTHFRNTIKANGGFKNTLYKLWRFDTVKHGCLMGWDSNGNMYYENQRYMIGRSRWVEYADYYKWEYEGTQVTPEWFGWLHYMTDQVPSCNPVKSSMRQSECYDRWLLPPAENLSGTKRAYYPYSTTRDKVYVWDGGARRITCNISRSTGPHIRKLQNGRLAKYTHPIPNIARDKLLYLLARAQVSCRGEQLSLRLKCPVAANN